jgi:flagellar L-ring protein precursor FlgH
MFRVIRSGNRGPIKIERAVLTLQLLALTVGCAPQIPENPYVPSRRYATAPSPGSFEPETRVARGSLAGKEWRGGFVEEQEQAATGPAEGRARIRLADAPPAVVAMTVKPTQFMEPQRGASDLGGDVRVMRSSERAGQPYRGPLELGDPGVTASLFRESQAGNEPFRDYRAWQPMDLVTIVVTEQSLGQQLANTEVKAKSEYLAAIENFFGLEKQTKNWTNQPDLTSLIQAQTRNDFRGEGRTLRQAQLNARVSAVVAEVLPSGLLRIEGEKIISVNNEEQVLVISGLVRQRDISSNNEVNASQIAQVRIDYYGKGTVGEAQYGGWLSRLLRILWPF